MSQTKIQPTNHQASTTPDATEAEDNDTATNRTATAETRPRRTLRRIHAAAVGNPADLGESGPSRPLRARLVTVLTALFLSLGVLGVLGVSAASADTYVAGHTLTTSVAGCAPSQLSILVGSNANDYSTNRYVQVVMWDYSAGQWVYGQWHQLGSYSLRLSAEFNFTHHGYFYPELHYAVLTSTGWVHGWETFPTFNQTNSISQNYTSTSCYI